jgi:FkbM family methyltransferase
MSVDVIAAAQQAAGLGPRGKPPALPARLLMRQLLRAWAASGRKAERLSRAVERWGPRLAGSALRTRLPNGCLISCGLGDLVGRQIYFHGVSEPTECFLLSRLLRPAMTVIDGGAHWGEYTLLAATAVGAGGSVHSFEPAPANFTLLERHVAINRLSNVRLNRAALWHEASTLALELPPEVPDNSGAWEIAAPAAEAALAATAPAVALDRYVEEKGLQRIDFVKLDLQGAEPQALAGARGALSRWRPLLLVELSRPHLARFGATPERLVAQLESAGYQGWLVGPSPRASGPLTDPGSVQFANAFFFPGAPPRLLFEGLKRRTARRWACRGWYGRGWLSALARRAWAAKLDRGGSPGSSIRRQHKR